MPAHGKSWRHVVISTLNSWLPGDGRGWRSRGHRRHSSGDYKNPPPPDEHAGLHRYSKKISGEPILIPTAVRPHVGAAIIHQLHEDRCRLLILSVSAMHCHMLVELPDALPEVKRIVGRAKNFSSRMIRPVLPGRVWATGGDFDKVRDRLHHRNTYGYILTRQGPGAWIWTFQQGLLKCPG